MDSQIVVRESSLPVAIATPLQWAERRRAFNEWVNTQLKEGVDYGKVPGTDKKTLLKPGAEKVTQYFGTAPVVEVTHREQHLESGYLYLEVKVSLVSIQTGQIIGTGIGACSSYESKYRWRWEWWNRKGQPEENTDWETFQKKNGSMTWRRRVENRDLIDQWNTVVKMAKKRGLVDAALTVSGASEKFTQDIEDFAEDTLTPDAPPPKAETPVQPTEPAPVKRRKWLSEYDPASQQAWLKEACKYFSITDAEFWVLAGAADWDDLKISSPELKANIGDAIEAKAGTTEKVAAQ